MSDNIVTLHEEREERMFVPERAAIGYNADDKVVTLSFEVLGEDGTTLSIPFRFDVNDARFIAKSMRDAIKLVE